MGLADTDTNTDICSWLIFCRYRYVRANILVGLSWDVDMLLSDLETAKEDTPSISDYVLSELIFGLTFLKCS